ncbi:MAG: hypothetical protein KAU28_04535, partial [Phycisphaerae bacterium]|nr:hypothetical protein [Phycisphaerae bacterium]
MARRKKLNKRVVILLIAFGMILAVAGVIQYLRKLPKDPDKYAKMGDAYFQQNRYAEADGAYAVAISEAKTLKDKSEYCYKRSRVQLRWSQVPGMTNTERTARRSRYYDFLERALRLDSSNVEAQESLCDYYWSRVERWGRLTEDVGRYIEEADKLLKLKPDDAETFYRRGVANAKMAGTAGGPYVQNAIDDCYRAIELKKDESRYWRAYIQVLQNLKWPDEDVEKAHEESIAENPDSAELLSFYALYLWNKGSRDEALEKVREASVRAPNSPAGHLTLAEFLLKEHKAEEALAALETAQKISPYRFEIYRKMAGIHHGLGRFEKANEIFRLGLEAVDRQAKEFETKKTSLSEFLALEKAKFNLSYFLAQVLFDMIERNPEDKDKLLDETRACLKELARQGDVPQKLKIEGLIAAVERRTNEAVDLLERANKGFGQLDARSSVALTNLYLLQGRPGQAEIIVDKFLKHPGYSKSATFLTAKARLLLGYKDYAGAEGFVDKA